MLDPMVHPIAAGLLSFIFLWLAAWFGNSRARKRRPLEAAQDRSFHVIEASALTLLGLIIGFTFSMAVNRYDTRKNYEEAEANAIGTEFVRADLLPPEDAAQIRPLLLKYLDQRLIFYTTHSDQELQQCDRQTAQLQAALWSAAVAHVDSRQNAVTALAVSGMNDVLNSQGYTQAAWWNGIPIAAWYLMVSIAVACNFLVGFGSRSPKSLTRFLLVLPLVLSITLLLIADIAAPRQGLIRVVPQNLLALSQSLHNPPSP